MSSVTRHINTYLQIVFAFVVFLSLNAAGEYVLSSYRFDLTEDKLFTVSPGGQAILDKLNSPVTLTYYFSETSALGNPPLLRYGRRVKDFLRAVERAGAGQIRLRIVDVAPFSPEEDEATLHGLQPVLGEGDQKVFMGLVAADETDRLETVPGFSFVRDRFLEYDVLKTIYLLGREGKPRVGFLTSLPMRYGLGGAVALLQGQSQPYILYTQLSQFFELVDVDAGFTALPPNLDALLVVHPPALSQTQLYDIDQAVLGGLPALVFVDPYAEIADLLPSNNFSGAQAVESSSDLAPLLSSWGIKFDPQSIVVDQALAQRARIGDGASTRVVEYPNWIGVRTAQLNPDNPAIADFALINFASAGSLKFSGGPELTFRSQITTSDQASLIPTARVRGSFDPTRLMEDVATFDRLTLLAEIKGIARSAFASPSEKTAKEIYAPEGSIYVWVGADSDLFDDQFWVRLRSDDYGQTVLVPIADNAALVITILDQIAGDGALANLQARGVSFRPLEVFDAMKRAAAQRTTAEEARLTMSLKLAEQRLLASEAKEREVPGGDTGEDMQALREEVLQIRNNLRDVERRLRADVASLELHLILLNSALVPGILLLLTGALWAVKRRRRRR